MKHPSGETPIYNEEGHSNEMTCICDACGDKYDIGNLFQYAGAWLCDPCIRWIEEKCPF